MQLSPSVMFYLSQPPSPAAGQLRPEPCRCCCCIGQQPPPIGSGGGPEVDVQFMSELGGNPTGPMMMDTVRGLDFVVHRGVSRRLR